MVTPCRLVSTFFLVFLALHYSTSLAEGCKKDKDKKGGSSYNDCCECYCPPRYEDCGYPRYSAGRQRGGPYRGGGKKGGKSKKGGGGGYQDCYDDYDDCCCDYDDDYKKGDKNEEKMWKKMMKMMNKDKEKDKDKGKDKKKSRRYDDCCYYDPTDDDDCDSNTQTIVVKNGPAVIQTVIVDEDVYSKYITGFYNPEHPLQKVILSDENALKPQPTYATTGTYEPQVYRVIVKDHQKNNHNANSIIQPQQPNIYPSYQQPQQPYPYYTY